MNIFFLFLFTGFSQTLNNANACKGGNTTQGIPCKKPVLSLLGIAVCSICTMDRYLIRKPHLMHIKCINVHLIIKCINMHLIIECIDMHLIIKCINMHLNVKCI